MRPRATRTRNWPLAIALVVGLALGALATGHGRLWTVPGLDSLEQRSLDWRFQSRGPRPLRDARIVIVGLDDETRRVAPDVFQTRRGWARLVRALAAAEPDAIALDLFYSAPEYLLLAGAGRPGRDRLRRRRGRPRPGPGVARRPRRAGRRGHRASWRRRAGGRGRRGQGGGPRARCSG
jgi:CHASE2 domain-containing sensor protein